MIIKYITCFVANLAQIYCFYNLIIYSQENNSLLIVNFSNNLFSIVIVSKRICKFENAT